MAFAFLTRTDGRAVGDRIGQEGSEQHRLQRMQRLYQFSALLTRADSRAVGDHVVQEASAPHRLQQMQRL